MFTKFRQPLKLTKERILCQPDNNIVHLLRGGEISFENKNRSGKGFLHGKRIKNKKEKKLQNFRLRGLYFMGFLVTFLSYTHCVALPC